MADDRPPNTISMIMKEKSVQSMPKILLALSIILFSTGCTNIKTIEQQQKQIDNLITQLESTTSQLEELSKQEDPAQNTTQKNDTSIPTRNIEDPDIKIERCKSKSKLYSEQNAKKYSESEVNEIVNNSCSGRDMSCVDDVFNFLNNTIDDDKDRLYEEYYSECLIK